MSTRSASPLGPPSCPDDEQLSGLLEADADADADAAERARLEAHVETCPLCRRALDELRALREGLGRLRDTAPSAEVVIRVAVAVQRRRRRSFWWGTGAVGGLCTAVVATGLLLGSRVTIPVETRIGRPPTLRASAEAEFRQAELHYRNALRMLELLVEEEKTRWPWSRQAAYEADLRILARAVEQSRKLVSRAPEDSALQELLFSSYRAQISYLREMLSPGADDAI